VREARSRHPKRGSRPSDSPHIKENQRSNDLKSVRSPIQNNIRETMEDYGSQVAGTLGSIIGSAQN